jgi:iron complex outermembrane receptor protein
VKAFTEVIIGLLSVVRRAAYVFLGVALLGILVLPAWPQEKSADLTDKSLEDLMNMEVTSVSKKEQKLSRTASAIFVITQEDIRRSGATNIPDLLRMVPGLDVTQINANTWAINVRGFVEEFSNELLVLVDGRSVYTQGTAGVYWDALDLPLEDIERIEVIRGPGGGIWGGNAVNGVVNILTKKAGETSGVLLSSGAGNLNQGFGTAQYGGSFGKNVDYRVFTKYDNFYHQPNQTSGDGGDGWNMLRSGFRVDANLTSKDSLLVQCDFYTIHEGEPTTFISTIVSTPQNTQLQSKVSGGFLQTVWNHSYSDRSEISLQASFDRYTRTDPQLPEARDTLNLEFQHHLQAGRRHDIVWGGQYQNTSDSIGTSLDVVANPSQRVLQIFSAFFQDEIALVPDRVYLTLGAKLEHNDYTGLNVIPNVRLAWAPGKRDLFWAAVSRGIRTPGRIDTEFRENNGGSGFSGGLPVETSIFGNPHFKDEDLIAYEVGYRTTVSPTLFFDFTAFFNSYGRQGTIEPGAPFLESTSLPVHIVQPFTYKNLMHGEGHGLEVFANWKASSRLTLSPGYAFEEIHTHLSPTSGDTQSVSDAEGSNPRNSAQLRSHFELARALSWDASAYFVGRLVDPGVPSYTRVDTGLTWRLADKFSASAVGQNLVRDRHIEFQSPGNLHNSTMVKRSVYAKFTWRF